MKGKLTLILLFLSVANPAFSQENEDGNVSERCLGLEDCIKMAYSNYPQIQEYGLIETSKAYDLANAALAWVPQISVSAKASWQSTVVEMPFDIPGFKFNIPHDQYGVTADLSQQIWDGGAYSVKKRMIEADAKVRSSQLSVNLYTLRSRVQNVYLGILLIDRQIELNDRLSSSLGRKLDEVSTLISNGVASESDRSQVKVSILSCSQQKTVLLADRKAYVKMLGLLSGTELENVTLETPDCESFKIGESMQLNRPELALYDAQSSQNALQQEQLKTALSPRLNLNLQGGYGRPGLNMLSGKFDPYFTAGLKLQWNLAPIYSLKNDRNKAKADAQRIDMARSSFILNTTVEAQQKQSEIEKAAAVLKSDAEILELRKSIRETAEYQYREGIAKMNDYLNFLDDEYDAMLNYNLHQVQYIMAVLDLQNTIGTE